MKILWLAESRLFASKPHHSKSDPHPRTANNLILEKDGHALFTHHSNTTVFELYVSPKIQDSYETKKWQTAVRSPFLRKETRTRPKQTRKASF
jgi:hypothetical protein